VDVAKAVVQKIVEEGNHGAFAVATSDAVQGSTTFSLEPTVWQEQSHPEPGEIVLLGKLRLKRAGWRAKEGRYFNPSDEQTESRKEQVMSPRISSLMEYLNRQWILREEDAAWKAWVDFKSRGQEDLIELLSVDVRETFKARALFLLLVPLGRWNTIYWKGELGVFRKSDFFRHLSPALACLAVSLISTFLDETSADVDGLSRHELGAARRYYNDALVDILTALPEEEAMVVFEQYSLNDPVAPWCDAESHSGYKSLRTLFSRDDVDVKWKWLAHERMQRLIMDEVAGKALPPASWEAALPHYADVMQSQLYHQRGLSYPPELFVAQIRLVTDEVYFGQAQIELRNLSKIASILAGNTHKDVRCQLYRFVLLGNTQTFQIWDESLLRFAKLMLSELGNGDGDLIKRIQLEIDAWDEQAKKIQARQLETNKAEEMILSQMR
jgi:hypothetical protein